MRKRVTLIVAGLVLLWIVGSAGATQVDTWARLTSTSWGLGCTVTFPVYNSSGVYTGQVTEGTVVGIYDFTQVNSSPTANPYPRNPGLPVLFDAFCMDLKQFVYYTPTISHWSEMRQLGLDGSDDGPWPGPHGAPMTLTQKTNLLKLFGLHNSDVTLSTTNAAAFGAAVWEIVWETSGTLNPSGALDVTAGYLSVSVNSGAQTLANTWLGQLASYNPSSYPEIQGLLDNTPQDQLVLIIGGTGGPENPIPEPVTMAGLMMGIGGLVTYVRKRRTA